MEIIRCASNVIGILAVFAVHNCETFSEIENLAIPTFREAGCENSISRQQAKSKNEPSESRDIVGPAPMTNSLCQRQEKRRMRQKVSQIGNPG
jgi:hypothetical protein